MPTCGYTCPKCEGRGFDDEMKDCDWCQINSEEQSNDIDTITEEQSI
jgi:hypothetical protein